jgi:hypothetical protein
MNQDQDLGVLGTIRVVLADQAADDLSASACSTASAMCCSPDRHGRIAIWQNARNCLGLLTVVAIDVTKRRQYVAFE